MEHIVDTYLKSNVNLSYDRIDDNMDKINWRVRWGTGGADVLITYDKIKSLFVVIISDHVLVFERLMHNLKSLQEHIITKYNDSIPNYEYWEIIVQNPDHIGIILEI